jgi:chemotaxis protein methyltransferase CheR
MFSVSVSDAKSVIRLVDRQYGVDLSGRSMASLRLRISRILHDQNIKDIPELTKKISGNKPFFEIFLRELYIGSPDMFRDPDFWKYLKNDLLPDIVNVHQFPEFIIPESVTGNELYTVKVLLAEARLDYRVDVSSFCGSNLLKEQVANAELSHISYKSSKDNYETFNSQGNFEDYIEKIAGRTYLKKNILEGTRYGVQSSDTRFCSEKTALVLYRNRMIYQTHQQQYRMLKFLLEQLPQGSYFAIGIGESIHGFRLGHLYETISEELKIYRKRDVN